LFIFETHFHADFVSGHLDLSKATGAPIVYGPTAKTDFESIIATDNQEFQKKQYKSVAYPGHTMETTYLLLDEMVAEHAIFW
jgi:glyoxylase-like metal-dependent hydrolase (beta-lactamase superfamily II)